MTGDSHHGADEVLRNVFWDLEPDWRRGRPKILRVCFFAGWRQRFSTAARMSC